MTAAGLWMPGKKLISIPKTPKPFSGVQDIGNGWYRVVVTSDDLVGSVYTDRPDIQIPQSMCVRLDLESGPVGISSGETIQAFGFQVREI